MKSTRSMWKRRKSCRVSKRRWKKESYMLFCSASSASCASDDISQLYCRRWWLPTLSHCT